MKTLFKSIQKQAAKMKPLQGDAYFKEQAELNKMLREMLDLTFTDLSKAQLIELLCLCGSHRPVEPFKVLIKVSKASNQPTA